MSIPDPPADTPVPTDRTPLLPAGSAGSDGAETDLSITKSHDDLRRVADTFPLSVWLIATIELCERAAYFGTLAPMQNYIQNSRNDAIRGGIGTTNQP